MNSDNSGRGSEINAEFLVFSAWEIQIQFQAKNAN